MKNIKENKNLLKKAGVIVMILTFIGSIYLNLVLIDKSIHNAYRYKNNIVDLNVPMIETILQREVNETISNLNIESNGTFTGERINGKKEGEGMFVWNDGSTYKGNFLNDKINGEGTLTIPGKGKYEGNFINGKRSGEGTYYFTNGDKYTGSWENDIMSGYGTYTFNNGDYYTGQFLNNKFHGEGTYKKGANRYTGTWSNNKYQK